MLAGRDLSPSAARALIAARPEAGWHSSAQFWSQPGLRALQPDNDVLAQVAVRTRFFRLRARVENGFKRPEQAPGLFDGVADQPGRTPRGTTRALA